MSAVGAFGMMAAYVGLLARWSTRIRLTASHDPRVLVERHLADATIKLNSHAGLTIVQVAGRVDAEGDVSWIVVDRITYSDGSHPADFGDVDGHPVEAQVGIQPLHPLPVPVEERWSSKTAAPATDWLPPALSP